MKKIYLTLSLFLALMPTGLLLRAADAPTNAPAPPERSVTERLVEIVTYLKNLARNGSTNAPSKIAGPGPGHNGFQMTCAALVLFMTLPGLALFYGNLVRKKNV